MKTGLEIDPRLPIMGKRLLQELHIKKLTMPDFDKECAYWLLNYIEDLRCRPNPTEPEVISVYFERRRSDPKYTVSSEFWTRPEVKMWRAETSHIFCLNKSNWYWLNFLKNHIPAKDVANHSKVAMMMNTYPQGDSVYVPQETRKDFQ